jgi:hypothetical protein
MRSMRLNSPAARSLLAGTAVQALRPQASTVDAVSFPAAHADYLAVLNAYVQRAASPQFAHQPSRATRYSHAECARPRCH